MKKNLAICFLIVLCLVLGCGWYKTAQQLKNIKEILEISMALHDVDAQIADLKSAVVE